MPDISDEATAAFALASRLAIVMAAHDSKALTDCMESLLRMERQGAAALLHSLHAAILGEMPEGDGMQP